MWANDVILEFLELYRTEQLLWDPKHPMHRNRSEVSDAWLRIQSSLSVNFSITDLKKKKESLMTSFRFHWNKKRRSQDYRTTWFAYSLMESFLSEKYVGSTNDLEDEFFNNTTTYNETSVSDHQYTAGRNIVERLPLPAKPRPVQQPIEIKINNVKNTEAAKRPEESATADKDGTDEYDLYGQLLAKKLRKLDEHQRDVAMHEIDNVMFRVKMQGSQVSQARSYSTSPTHGRKVKSPLFISPQQSHAYEDESLVYEQDPMQGQTS